jgi:hypothetical protein
MSAQAQQRAADVAKKEQDLAALNRELELDLAQSAIDIAGIADPTPISDVIGAGMSLWRGDFIGAGLSLISVVPYAGDAVGKTAKGARLAKKMAALRKSIVSAIDSVNAAKKVARQQASAATRALKAARKAGKQVDDALCTKCLDDFIDPNFGTRMPRGGFSGTRGASDWVPNPASTSKYNKDVLAWQKKNGAKFGVKEGDAIPYRDGFPDFSKYVYKNADGVPANPKINMTGNDYADFKSADDAMRKLDPDWEKPPGWTWHHVEDGVTMQLVPTKINSIPHTGGASLTKHVPGY